MIVWVLIGLLVAKLFCAFRLSGVAIPENGAANVC